MHPTTVFPLSYSINSNMTLFTSSYDGEFAVIYIWYLSCITRPPSTLTTCQLLCYVTTQDVEFENVPMMACHLYVFITLMHAALQLWYSLDLPSQ